MSNFWKTTIECVVALMCGFIIFLLIMSIIHSKPQPFNKLKFERVHIYNTIKEQNFLDTIVYSGLLNQNLQGLVIVIKPLTKQVQDNFRYDLKLKAHIYGKDSTYIVWIDPSLQRSEYIEVLSHELIHLNQYVSKQLVVNSGDLSTVLWKGESINLSEYSYELRPWEIDAFSKQENLKSLMIKTLYYAGN